MSRSPLALAHKHIHARTHKKTHRVIFEEEVEKQQIKRASRFVSRAQFELQAVRFGPTFSPIGNPSLSFGLHDFAYAQIPLQQYVGLWSLMFAFLLLHTVHLWKLRDEPRILGLGTILHFSLFS